MGNIDRQDLSVSVSISEEMSWHLHAPDFTFQMSDSASEAGRSCFLPVYRLPTTVLQQETVLQQNFSLLIVAVSRD